MEKIDICTLFKERKTRELTPRQKVAVDFWEVVLNTELENSMDVFDIADAVDEVLNSPEVS